MQGSIVLDEGWRAFPRIKWMARFESRAIHEKNTDWKSRLAVCRFTPGLPTNFDRMVAEVVAKLDWERIAEDFDASR